jgi:CO/xanthine dehydrogenase FAD-binding subunit
MPGRLSGRELLRPRSLGEALRMMRNEPGLTPLAGCTDLYVSLQFDTLTPTKFVDLWPLEDLRGIRRTSDGLWIGALSTHTDLIQSPLVRRHLPMLAAACREVGGVQIQQRGTIGGNVANASPAGDTLPVLAVAEAVVELASVDGVRRVPFAGFYTGYRRTVARPDELIVGFQLPTVDGRQWFRKVGTRAAQAISKVVFAGVGGASPRIALGSVAPTVLRLARTEQTLASGAGLEAAVAQLHAEIAPIDDIRSTGDYRRRVAENLLMAFWSETGGTPQAPAKAGARASSTSRAPTKAGTHRSSASGAPAKAGANDSTRHGSSRRRGR